MTTTPLNEREQHILQAVVHLYTTTAEPVGSRAIVKRFGLDISPATVRNVMADLEEAGYLQQLHTSSGRVPTDKGYRYYVDYLMRIQEITHSERTRLEQQITDRLNDADAILRETSYLLALISHQTGIIEPPRLNTAELRHLELIPISDERVAILLADNYGGVQTMVLTLETGTDTRNLHRLNRFLNEHLRGTPIDELADSLNDQLEEFAGESRVLAGQALELVKQMSGVTPKQLFLEGTTQLFEQPEFQSIEKARQVFGLLEERERLVELLRAGVVNPEPHPSMVVIGSEAHQQGFEELSVVSAPYRIGERQVGMVGVLGPRRMPYSKLSGLVEFTAERLSSLLTRLAR